MQTVQVFQKFHIAGGFHRKPVTNDWQIAGDRPTTNDRRIAGDLQFESHHREQRGFKILKNLKDGLHLRFESTNVIVKDAIDFQKKIHPNSDPKLFQLYEDGVKYNY